MKKLQILCLAMVGMFVLSAVMAMTASAEVTLLAEWLVNGLAVTTTLATSTSDELLLEDTGDPLGVIAFLCSALFESNIKPDGADELTKVLTLTGSVGLQCVRAAGTICEEGSEVSLTGLPILTQLFLMENGNFLDLLTAGSGKISYEIECLILGTVLREDKCSTSDAEIEMVNVVSGVEERGEQTPAYSCSRGSEGGEPTLSGLISVLGSLITPVEGGTLSVSSE